MQFRAEDYFSAALDRMAQARRLLEEGSSYALSMYCAGLAVECLLRAFRWAEDDSFEGRHDLRLLLKASRLLVIDDEYALRRGTSAAAAEKTRVDLRAAMNEVVSLWHNNLRFASEKRLKSFLKDLGRLKGVKGDPLKKNASDLVNASGVVLERGVTLWISRTKS